MSFLFDPEKLQGHPCVYKVDPWKLALTYDFRVRLYKAWKQEQKPAEILSILQEEGLTEDLVEQDFFMSVAYGFKVSGYRLYGIFKNIGDRQCALQGLEIMRVEIPSGKELTTPPEVSFELLVVTLVAKRKQRDSRDRY